MPSVNRLFTSEVHFKNDTEKKMFELLCSFLGFLFVSYTSVMPNWLVYDRELGLYWLNSAKAPFLNQIPCGSLICTTSVDFICWNCAFDIDLDSMLPSSFK